MKRNIIRQIYFYAASLITLVIMVIAGAQLVNLGLKSTVFPKADDIYNVRCSEKGNRIYGYERPLPTDETVTVESRPEQRELTAEKRAAQKKECEASIAEERSAQRQSDFVQNFSMIFVAVPVFWFHFRTAQREREEEKKQTKKT